MKKRFFAIVPATVLILGLMACTSSSPTAQNDGAGAAPSATNPKGGLATLRGVGVADSEVVHNLALNTPIDMRQAANRNFDRNFEEQPPLVSHTVDEYPVTLKSNGCMDCHSRENAKKEKASPVPRSHFQTADGKALSSLASRRHFCVQCHVPQVDARPLIANDFQKPL
jgi:cytochrome c-type protein NapB